MTKIDQVLKLADGTRTRYEVAALLGIKHTHIGAFIYKLVRRGDTPKFKPFREPESYTYVKVARILELDPTLTVEQVAMVADIDKKVARHAIDLAKKRGFKVAAAPHQHTKSFDTLVSNGRLRVGGGVGQMMRKLPQDVRDWLVAQVPEGADCSDVIAAILVDAYFEEKGEPGDGRA